MQVANSSYTTQVPNIYCRNMPIARFTTFLIFTSFLSTIGHLGAPAFGALDDDLLALDIVSKIHTDRSLTVRASSDFGHIVEATPNGVFHPVSPADIAALIRFSLYQQTPFTVAPRGKGHSSRGQASPQAALSSTCPRWGVVTMVTV